MNKDILTKENYLSETRYVFGSTIYEYDMRQANIHILYSYKLLSDNDYQMLLLAPKQDREKFIGYKEHYDVYYNHRQKSIYNEAKVEGILKARELLISTNNIEEYQILRAATDSLFVNRALPLENTVFDLNNNGRTVEYVLKNIYDTYLLFSNKEIVLIKNLPDNFDVHVIGINDNKVQLHATFLSAISQIAYTRGYNIQGALDEFDRLYEDYVNLHCPVSMYREFNNTGIFRFKNSIKYQIYPTELPEDFDKSLLDIGYNLQILRELYTYIYK